MNFKDIAGNADREMIFDAMIEEACRQWCAFFPDTPDRMEGEGFANFFYKVFEQKEAEYLEQAEYLQEVKESSGIRPKKTDVQPTQPKIVEGMKQTATSTEQQPKSGPVQENEAVQKFLKLLMENRPEKGNGYSAMLWQVDGMERKLEQALSELQAVKQELSQMQENPAKQTASRVVQGLEQKIHALQERLSDIKGMIVENAKQAVENVKQTSISALDKTVSFLGIGKALNAIREDLRRTMAETAKSIEKIETIGHELRSVGGHLKNASRAVAGKERNLVDGGTEGRFQAAILAPMRMEKTILSQLSNMTLAAISGVERLEQAAGRNREQPETAEPEQSVELDEELVGHNPMEKEKPSVLEDLRDKKAQAAAHTAPAKDKQMKPPEAAL